MYHNNNKGSFRSRRPEPKEDTQLIYGIRPVMEAIHAGKEIDRMFICRGAKGELMGELKELLKEKNITYTEVPIEKLHRITRNNHQDVVCYISSITYHKLTDIVPFVFEKGQVPLILILDRITDVRNFGAIARTAECSGVHAIVIPGRGAAQASFGNRVRVSSVESRDLLGVRGGGRRAPRKGGTVFQCVSGQVTGWSCDDQ